MRRSYGTTRHRQRDRAEAVSTVIWGADVERNDFVKVPRTLLRLGAYSTMLDRRLQPRHILLLLNLASRRYRDTALIVEWKNLGRDLGVRADTIRHWAYELREMKLITIGGQFADAENGNRRLRGVEIDISGFISLVADAFNRRRNERRQLFERRQSDATVWEAIDNP